MRLDVNDPGALSEGGLPSETLLQEFDGHVTRLWRYSQYLSRPSKEPSGEVREGRRVHLQKHRAVIVELVPA